jgi:hypothetical protein
VIFSPYGDHFIMLQPDHPPFRPRGRLEGIQLCAELHFCATLREIWFGAVPPSWTGRFAMESLSRDALSMAARVEKRIG